LNGGAGRLGFGYADLIKSIDAVGVGSRTCDKVISDKAFDKGLTQLDYKGADR